VKIAHSNKTILWPLCLLATAQFSLAQEVSKNPIVLGNEQIRVSAWIEEGLLHEDYLAWDGREWIVMATAAEGGSVGPSTVYSAENAVEPGSVESVAIVGGELSERLVVRGCRVLRKIALCSRGPWLHVTTLLQPDPNARMHAFVDRFKFTRRPDSSFASSVGGFVPDAQYKAPLILVQSARMAFAVVPDVAALNRDALRQCNHAMDLNVPAGPLLGVGFIPARLAYHSVYEHDRSRTWTAAVPLMNSYYLLATARAQPGEAYREAVRMHWSQFGRPTQLNAALQQVGTDTPPGVYSWLQSLGPVGKQMALDKRLSGLTLWEDWRREVWGNQSRQEWLLVPLDGGRTGGGVLTRRWGPGPSIYLTAWFNTLRTSYGMALYARRIGDHELLRLARQTLELALSAPGLDGAFKCIAVPTEGGKHVLWAAGDGAGNSTAEGYLGYDMSWTAYWLLRWRSAGLSDNEAILPRCRALAKFLVDRKLDDGMLPTRFKDDGAVDLELSRTVKAETGPVALFLLELYAQDPDPRWLKAGEQGLAFLDKNVIPQRQWYDFETFWSCSPRAPIFDERSHQWPANDLALGQSVAAYLSAYRATGDSNYLEKGKRLLDYLLLYQQCWTNPLLDHLTGPATLLGGFTTQNSDAEWSDARQSQVGNILVDYYRATGTVEYLERGVAALRAQFPVSPCENWAHSGYGSKTGISSFHWGTGSGMAGIEIDEDFLRDAVVDVAEGQAVGVNGLNVTHCTEHGGEIHLDFSSPIRWTRAPVFVFHRCDPAQAYRIVANGGELGTWKGSELERGITIPLARF
jgi:hypothetical protein